MTARHPPLPIGTAALHLGAELRVTDAGTGRSQRARRVESRHCDNTCKAADRRPSSITKGGHQTLLLVSGSTSLAICNSAKTTL